MHDIGNYIIEKNGKVFSNFSNKYLKPYKNKDGYLHVDLWINKKRHTYRLHILIAERYVEGWFPDAEVNHKDGNKENNDYTNLEWATRKENIQHAYNTGLRDSVRSINSDFCKNNFSKSVKVVDKNNMEIIYFSANEAARQLNIYQSTINRRCNKGNNTWFNNQYKFYYV
jgi:hypothetical protein